MWLKTHGANKPEGTCHFDAQMWRQLHKPEDFVYDGEVPANCTAGYAITVQHRSHQFCGCVRSRLVILFFAHREAFGDFPVIHRVSDFWVEQLMQERPELSAPLSGGYCSYGYIWMCVVDVAWQTWFSLCISINVSHGFTEAYFQVYILMYYIHIYVYMQSQPTVAYCIGFVWRDSFRPTTL